MTKPTQPRLLICINYCRLWDQPLAETPWTLEERLQEVKSAGFEAVSCPVDDPRLRELLAKYDLRFAGAFQAGAVGEFAPIIAANLAIDSGPMNCQLGAHDTPIPEAVRLTAALMEEAQKQNADVHLELHRDTCTETPEKAAAIIAGVREAAGVRATSFGSCPNWGRSGSPGWAASQMSGRTPSCSATTSEPSGRSSSPRSRLHPAQTQMRPPEDPKLAGESLKS